MYPVRKIKFCENFICDYSLNQIAMKNFKIFQFAKRSEFGWVLGVF